MIGLLLLKPFTDCPMRGLRALGHDPYFQYFTGEGVFQHAFPHESCRT